MEDSFTPNCSDDDEESQKKKTVSG
jgi:hypothetical protein